MKHPAFDTGTDVLTRKNASEMAALEAQQAEEAAQQQKEADAKEQQAQASQSSSNQAKANAQTNGSSTTAESTKTIASPVTAEEAQKAVKASIEATSAQANASDATKKAQEALDSLNSTLSSLCMPIYSVISMLKTLPDRLNSLVDVEGAAAGAYSGLTSIADTLTTIETVPISSEVPITLDDFSACPTQYPYLQDMLAMGAQLTEADCIQSGYTKTIVENQWKFLAQMKDVFQASDEKSIVADNLEKAINSTLKFAVAAIQPPVQMIASIANIGPLGGMVTEVTNMIDGIGKMATTPLPKDMLDEKIREQQMAAEEAKAEADKAANSLTTAKEHGLAALDSAKSAADQGIDNAKQAKDELSKSMTGAFDNLRMPTMPDGLGEALEETWKSLTMVASNLQNVMLVVLFKLLEAVFKCFNEIVGIIGVPSMPYPLSLIPQLIPAVIDIAMFVITFPISLYNAIKTIAKRKVKAMVVADLPTPPKIEPTIQPIAPTSDDVPTPPEATWDDVAKVLEQKYEFSANDAASIVAAIQEFYDGSDSKYDEEANAEDPNGNNGKPYDHTTKVIDYIDEVDSVVSGKVDHIPVFTNVKRILITPAIAIEVWLPAKVSNWGEIMVPEKNVYSRNDFWEWHLNRNGTASKSIGAFQLDWAYKSYSA